MSNGPNSQETSQTQGFTPPRHWLGVEELDPGYWADPKIQEKRGQEFYEKPVEWLDKMDKTGETGIARRDFLTVMGASMAMASLSCARRPVNKIIPYVVQPEQIVPGVPTVYASTSKDCPCGCGLLVKTREGRPIKLEGNPDHPINKGALCSQAQASVLGLYDTDRLKHPLKRTRGGESQKVDWNEVDTQIAAALKRSASGRGNVRVLTSHLAGHSTPKLIKDFLSAFNGGRHVEFEPIGLEEIPAAQERSYGTAVTPAYHFDKADVVVSLGADFLGSWLSHVEHSADWAKGRKLDSAKAKQAKLSKLIVFEPTMSLTGANADERHPIRPGDELKIAMAIAHEIIIGRRQSRFAGDAVVAGALASYAPDKVAADVGLADAAPIRKAAEELLHAKGKSLVVAGNIASSAGNQVFTQLAVNLLNSALENEGVTVDGNADATGALAGLSGLTKLVGEMAQGQVDVLFVYRTNPGYCFSKAVADFAAASAKVPLVVTITDRDDETGLLSDFVLPDHHYLENWGDSSVRPDLYSLQQPALAPLHDSRAFEDSLIVWAKRAQLSSGGLIARSATWHDFLQAHWQETLHRGSSQPFAAFWESCLRKGVFDARGGRAARPSARNFRSGSVSEIPAFAPLDHGLFLSLYASTAMHDGRWANNAWLQELPDPVSSVTWDNFVGLSPALGAKLSLKNDDVAELTVEGFSVDLPVRIQPGLHPEVAMVAVGYGRTAGGKVAEGCGKNVYPLIRAGRVGAPQFSGQSIKLRRTQAFYRLAATQWFNSLNDGLNTANRPIVNDISLTEFRENPAASMEVDPPLRMKDVPSLWPVHEYKSYRWGMAIDMNACTGCGSCTIACQAENNIPVVGRDQVRNSRHMNWLRIDRYYGGSPENPSVIFQPMLCQHCENAPCETVCPVLATVHDGEGLNVQVYNRCVGTRYCQNNCPYKVRRFNFFDHWKSYEGTMNLAWNPDVTVRTRGIMEKCTFCVQRIRDAKDHAKDTGTKVTDGQVVTACQQTCPSDAIVFGDINDPNSRVSKLRNDARAYRVLENLATKPAISYLTKVRNVPAPAKAEGHAEGGHHG